MSWSALRRSGIQASDKPVQLLPSSMIIDGDRNMNQQREEGQGMIVALGTVSKEQRFCFVGAWQIVFVTYGRWIGWTKNIDSPTQDH